MNQNNHFENRQKVLEHLNSLIHLEIDTVFTLETALSHLESGPHREHAERSRADHLQHILGLSDAIQKWGGDPPQLKPDLKGYLMEGLTQIRSLTGEAGALKAIQDQELTTHSAYDQAMIWDLPWEIQKLVEKNKRDEENHLHFMEEVLVRPDLTKAAQLIG